MGIPECILTVTTRITKYPLLIEPLIKTAKDRPAEQQKLRSCLSLVKSILIDVNGQVTFLSAFLQCDFFFDTSSFLSPFLLSCLYIKSAVVMSRCVPYINYKIDK